VGSAALLAQQPMATLTGILHDPNGKAVENTGLSIYAHSTATQAEFSALIHADGTFRLSLPPGTYDLNVPPAGAMYAAYEAKGVSLAAGETKKDIQVEWGRNLGTIADDPVMLMRDIAAMAKVPQGPAPRMPDGKPDLSGVWVNTYDSRVRDEKGPVDPPPQQPWAADVQKQVDAQLAGANAQSFCLPMSAMQFTLPFTTKIVQTPALVVVLSEFDTPGYRQIFLDGRSRPKIWNPAWAGFSVGKWEGDTLVVEVTGFNEEATGVGIHTEKLRIVERIRRLDLGHLAVDYTVEDPDAYTHPWTRSARLALAPQEEILEFICAENNKDPLHFGGLRYFVHRPDKKPNPTSR
jgi:hypothetical protein